MSFSYEYERRVAFADTDLAGVAHFTAILRWVEEAEAAWHRSRGDALARISESGSVVGWPRVSVRAEYHAPARFDSLVRILLSGESSGRSSLRWSFRIEDSVSTVLLASGEMRVVYAEIGPGGRVTVLPITAPDSFLR